MGLSPKYNDLGYGSNMADLSEVALSKICIVIFLLVFFFSNLCATPTPAIVVRHARVQYRKKERIKNASLYFLSLLLLHVILNILFQVSRLYSL